MGYLSGQGKCYQAARNAAGSALAFTFMGNVPSFELALNIDTLEHKESTSGQRLVDLRLVTGKKVDLTMNVQEFLPTNLAMMTFGNINTLGAGSVSGELLAGGATDIVIGQTVMLQNTNVTSLVITDSAGTPITLTSGVQYTPNLPYGLVTFNAIPGTQPYKAAYTKPTGQQSVDFFTTGAPIRWLRFLAINTAQENLDGSYKRFVLDLYNVQFDPTTGLPLINDAVADMNMKASVLIDPTRNATAVGGQIGQLIFID
jgi:hypothetical protein